jgi:hypothetical protein
VPARVVADDRLATGCAPAIEAEAPVVRDPGSVMHDDRQPDDQPAPGGRVERAVGRGCMILSMVGMVLVVGVTLLYLLAVGLLSGCGAAGGC